jgi:hypothetical protein
MNKLIKIVKNNWLFLLILAFGMFFRIYKPYQWFAYTHDQDLAAWFIKDVVFDRHIRLIGQETSSKGIFIGPLFYYLQIPFYAIFNWDSKGSVWLPVFLSLFSIWSYYFVFSKMFNKRVGLIACAISSFSYLIIFIEREVAPTMPVMLWTVWFLYSVWLILKGKQKAYILLGLLGGLIWDLNLALALLTPIVLLAQIFSKKKFNFKYLAIALSIFMVLMLPFFAFEARHGFQQTKSLVATFTTQKDYTQGTGHGFAKLDRVMQLVNKNANAIFLDSVFNNPAVWMVYLLVILFAILVIKKKISWQMATLMIVWQILFVLFFTFNSINTSEYYLNGMNVIWILISALAIGNLFEKNKYLGTVFILAIICINVYAYTRYVVNDSGYIQRKAIAKFIAEDAKKHGYPCVSVSYITTPGNNLGYRYFYFLEKLHVNLPKSESPVYTIVFPHSMVDRIDKSFGALGLVLPDYARYNQKDVDQSCMGEDANIAEPMFGFTK